MVFVRIWESGQTKNEDRSGLPYQIQVCAENTEATATGDKQDASGYAIHLLVCAPSNGLVVPIAEATQHCAHRRSRLPYAF